MAIQKSFFKDVSEIIMGQSPDGSTYNKDNIGLPLLNGPTEFTNRYPQKIQWTTKPTKTCTIDDILLCVRGSSTGRINISNDTYCIGRGIAAIRGKEGKTTTKFLEYQLIFGISNILRLTAGSTFPNIDKKSIGRIPLILPPIAEQKKIAEILGTCDRQIELTENLINAKRKLKQGLMQKLLTGKLRFPEFEGQRWKYQKLASFFEYKSDINSDQKFSTVFSCTKNMGIILQSLRFKNPLTSSNLSRYKKIIKDDLIYDPMLLWDGSIGFMKEDIVGLVSPAYMTFSPKKNVDTHFFEGLFDTDFMKYKYKSISQGTNQRRRKASFEQFLNLSILLPTNPDEIKKISSFYTCLSNDLKNLGTIKDSYQQQKKGLMQQLLTGKTRVKVD